MNTKTDEIKKLFRFDENTNFYHYRDNSNSPFPAELLEQEVRRIFEGAVKRLAQFIPRIKQ